MLSSLNAILFLAMTAAVGHADAGRTSVPDPVVQTWSAEAAIVAAPEKHHFNLEAPNKAFVLSGGARKPLKLKMANQEARVGLEGTSPNEKLRAELFLCDDAKTYCVKKVVEAQIPSSRSAPKKKALSSG